MLFKVRLIFAVFAALFLVGETKAVTCYAVNDADMLLSFDSTTPGTTTSTAISGLPAGYSIVGLDFRTTVQTTGAANPGAGTLWALGNNGTLVKVFVINPTTATATLIGNLATVDATGSDNAWFFGFNPATDRLRIMNFIHNYEVNPNTLAVVSQPMSTFPNLNGSAFTTASFGGTSQIYFLDQGNDGLNTSVNIATGNYTALPSSGVNFGLPAGLDIDGSLTLMACFTGGAQALFSMNRSTGIATAIGAISGAPMALEIRGLAIKPTTLPPILSATVNVKGRKKITTTKSSLVIKGTASSQAGISLVQYKIGKKSFKTAKGTTSWKFTAKLKPGMNLISVQATGRNDVKSSIAKVKIKAE